MLRHYFYESNGIHGRVSVCVEASPNLLSNTSGGDAFFAGITYCLPKDNFSFHQGREKSQGRLRQGLNEGLNNPRPIDKHFFHAVIPFDYYADKSSLDKFIDMLRKHIDSFVPAAMKKTEEPKELG